MASREFKLELKFRRPLSRQVALAVVDAVEGSEFREAVEDAALSCLPSEAAIDSAIVRDASAPADVDDLLDQIESSAKHHGEESEPEHEVGDLLDALRLAWARLSPADRLATFTEFFEYHDHWDEKEG